MWTTAAAARLPWPSPNIGGHWARRRSGWQWKRSRTMDELGRHMPCTRSRNDADREALLTREWLVTNGLGGYASGTVAGVATRRYHGLLIAAMPAPLGRVMMLNHVSEMVRLPGDEVVLLWGEERVPHLHVHGAPFLEEFRLEDGLPVWRYRVGE